MPQVEDVTAQSAARPPRARTDSPRSLRATVATLTVLVTGVAVLVSAALVGITSILHHNTTLLLESAERVQRAHLADGKNTVADADIAAWTAAHRRSASWNVAADITGGIAGATLIVTAIAFLRWMKRRAFHPILALGDALRRYGRGERDVRADVRGPAELREIARRFNEMAEALATRRDDQLVFAAAVAHDLRTPLGALKLAVQTIRPDRPLPPEPRLRRTLDIMHRQIDTVERMLGDFLDAARIEAGVLELDRAPHDVRAPVRNVVELFERTAPEHRIEASFPPEAVIVDGDAQRLEQVVSNLVSNAIKYSASGTVISVAVLPRDGEVAITVRDQGVGISAADQRGLFEPFRRVGETRRTRPGSGLGLFIVQRIVEAHGGRVTLASAPGHGTTVEVRLRGGLDAVGLATARASLAADAVQASQRA